MNTRLAAIRLATTLGCVLSAAGCATLAPEVPEDPNAPAYALPLRYAGSWSFTTSRRDSVCLVTVLGSCTVWDAIYPVTGTITCQAVVDLRRTGRNAAGNESVAGTLALSACTGGNAGGNAQSGGIAIGASVPLTGWYFWSRIEPAQWVLAIRIARSPSGVDRLLGCRATGSADGTWDLGTNVSRAAAGPVTLDVLSPRLEVFCTRYVWVTASARALTALE